MGCSKPTGQELHPIARSKLKGRESMEIVNCQFCGKETYAGQSKCPHCGTLSPEALDAMNADIAQITARGEYENLPAPELRKLIGNIIVTTESNVEEHAMKKRFGILFSNVPDSDPSMEILERLIKFGGKLSVEKMQELALMDLRFQALCLGANGVIAVTMAFTPVINGGKYISTGLFLSATGTAVSIEGLHAEASE